MAETKTCTDYADELGWTFTPGYLFTSCCNSCHEDHDEFGYSLISGPDGEEAEICCEVARALDSQREKATS